MRRPGLPRAARGSRLASLIATSRSGRQDAEHEEREDRRADHGGERVGSRRVEAAREEQDGPVRDKPGGHDARENQREGAGGQPRIVA